MRALHESLLNMQLIVFATLAASAFAVWRRRRDASSAWIAVTFTLLGVLFVAGRFVPRNTDAAWATWANKLLVVTLVAFPYCLYRFIGTMNHIRKPALYASTALTLLLATTILLIKDLPSRDEPRTMVLQVWAGLFVAQWVTLSTIAAVRLWRDGRGLPGVARRRMQTLASGAVGMTLAIVLGALARTPTHDASLPQILTQILGLVSAPLFLAGFAPPRLLLAFWRRREQAALEEATSGLMKAMSRQEIADAILGQTAHLVGGTGACLFDRDANVLGSYGITDPVLEALLARRHEWAPSSKPVVEPAMVRVSLQHGWLVILTSAFAPFFGEEEARLLQTLTAFVDLSLGRIALLEKERKHVETMRDFVSIAAHDLRSPVSAIDGYADLLGSHWEEFDEQDRKEMIGGIRRQSANLTRLTEDLLMVSRMEAEGVNPRPAKVMVAAAVERIVADLAPRFGKMAEVKVDPGLFVYVDPGHFDRIITNYLTNAYVYGRAPFEVQATDAGGLTQIVVKDQGEGVPVEFEKSLFGKFARADKKAMGGTGLGLSIVKGLAEAAGGHAWYRPNTPHGAAFAVELPSRAA